MNKIELNQKLMHSAAQRLRHQRACNAANSMMLQLKIPQGKNMLYILSQPQASDNKDAICRWILAQQGEDELNNSMYSELVTKLSITLHDNTACWI